MRRNQRGSTTVDDFNNWDEQPFEDMESSLCVQQWIQQQLFNDPEDMKTLMKTPKNTDDLVFQYEHLRVFIMELNQLVALLGDQCTSKSCPEMESDGQRFLCAAHVPPLECCAIDYMCHTLDRATAFVCNVTLFPGRMDVPKKSADQFASQIRRLYRIMLHCHSAHRELFDEVEESKCLCLRFTVFAKKYGFLDDETLTIPVEENAFTDSDASSSSSAVTPSSSEEENENTSSEASKSEDSE